VAAAACGAAEEQPAVDNIALGKSYVLQPAPNYALCTDPGDKTQLTDGVYTKGYFWTQKSTVGWQGGGCVSITVDLGKVEPICGAALNTAAGTAGVTWPKSIGVYVSETGARWRMLGDLVTMAPGDAPKADKPYGVYKYSTRALSGKGRYVRFLMSGYVHYAFCDEVEVYRGPEAVLQTQAAEPFGNEDFLTRIQYHAQKLADVRALRAKVAAAQIPDAEKARLNSEIDNVEQTIQNTPQFVENIGAQRMIVPLDDQHRELLALHGKLLALQGCEALTIWPSHRFAPLGLFETPNGERPGMKVRLMPGEERGEVLNFTNATASPIVIRLKVESLPTAQTEWVKLHQVEHVAVQGGVVAAALPDAPNEKGWAVIAVPAGMTRQIWFAVTPPRDVRSGLQQARIIIKNGEREQIVPLTLKLSACKFPAKTDLRCGMWDYVINRYGAVSEATQAAAFADMRRHRLNVTWANPSTAALPKPDGIDEKGNLTKPLDFTEFDRWRKMYPDAESYAIFMAVDAPTKMGKHARGTAEFREAVKQWAFAWEKHAQEQGLRKSQLQFHLLDEPHTKEQYAALRDWSEAVRAGSKEIELFNDPCFTDELLKDMETVERSLEFMNVLCPQLSYYNEKLAVRELMSRLKAKGKTLYFYMCSGPNRLFDPSYFRAQPWYCWRWGALGSEFWAYSDTGKARSNWNEFASDRGINYAPAFFDPQSITPSKQEKAILEGVEDYQYLRMLDELLKEEKVAGAEPAAAAQKPKLNRSLEYLFKELEARTKGNPCVPWNDAELSRVMDNARLMVLDALENGSKQRQ
jgi:hypothetical protein